MLFLAALSSGLLLALATRWRRGTWLLLVALLPFLAVLAMQAPGPGLGALAGALLGAAYVVPLVVHMRFPLVLAVGMSVYLALGFVMLGAGAALIFDWLRPVVAALAVTALVVVCDRLTVRVVPAWGTAQSWIRPLSRWVAVARLGRGCGQSMAMAGIVLVQALAAAALSDDPQRPLAAGGAAAVVLLLALASTLLGRFHPSRTLRVAAVGWDAQRLTLSGRPVTADELFEQPIARAAADGARLVVTPETGLSFGHASRAGWIARFTALSARLDVTLVIGYLDEASQENRAGIFTPAGGLVAEYAKSNLVIAAGEHLTCRAGRGDIVQVDVDGVRVGVLICHDDNFTAPARRHARAGTRLLAIPTNDWAAIKDAHLENVPWRAIENRLAIVRGASNGVSALIAPDGRILERMDHVHDGLGTVIGDVPVRE